MDLFASRFDHRFEANLRVDRLLVWPARLGWTGPALWKSGRAARARGGSWAGALLLMLAVLGPGAAGAADGALDALAESSAPVAPDADAAARAAAEPDPVAAALRLVGGGMEARSLRLESRRRAAEGPGPVTVVIVREGFADDSVRGDWHRVELSPDPDGVGWRVRGLLRAVRCQPGRGGDAWRDQRCR